MKDSDLYYSLNDLLSYNAEISICQSIRDLGKSYSGMTLAYNTLRKGGNIVWSRWDRDETDLAIKEFVNYDQNIEWDQINVSRALKMLQPKTDKNLGKIWFVPVKDAGKIKGIDRKIDYWIYDEFLPEFYSNRTRKEEEFAKWASLHTSLRRDYEPFRAILISNNISWFNGYFRAWGIRPFPAGQIRRYVNTVNYDLGDGNTKTYTSTVAFRNVRPSPLAINRVMRDEVAKGKNEAEIRRYLSNATQDKDYFIGTCPNLNAPLSSVLFFHHERYYAYRIYDNMVYFTEVRYRPDVPIMALNRRELRDGMMRDRGAGNNFERWINLGIARFDNPQVMDAIFDLVYLSRERL